VKAITCILFALILACIGCGSDPAPVVSSGDAGFDQTAVYARYLIAEVKQRPAMDAPSKVVGYMFSTIGSAELVPPHPEMEPDAAAHYHGPYPGEDTGLSDAYNPQAFSAKQLVLVADDAAQVIRARAYRTGEEIVLHEWEWPF